MEYPNWFEQYAQPNFELVLKDYAGKPDLRFLQIGAFTGDASKWMLDNILTDPSSRLVDVDTWEGSDEDVHKAMDFDDVFRTYLAKTGYVNPNRSFNKQTSAKFFTHQKEEYDFIYIDGDHTASGVLSDAVMGWQCLKSGGIMAFDDYTWIADSGLEIDSPRMSIQFFYWANQKGLDKILDNSQFWVKKK